MGIGWEADNDVDYTMNQRNTTVGSTLSVGVWKVFSLNIYLH